ncbi:MAG: DUF1643 domain-containing protein [Candidatus Lokiarchaeota archaeon]|nr:DUF1643 domain-containing protein [Candidatus Lokiarchaeota archaeon]
MVRILTAPPGTGGWLASSATFSDDMQYRYTLERILKQCGGRCVFIGLNPSTADELKNDPTVARCINYARAWGYGEFVMLNAFALRSTDPAALRSCDDPVGAENDAYIKAEVGKASIVVAAWGTHARLLGRHEALLAMLPALHCLGTTKEGYPKHPLYLRKDLAPVAYIKEPRRT